MPRLLVVALVAGGSLACTSPEPTAPDAAEGPDAGACDHPGPLGSCLDGDGGFATDAGSTSCEARSCFDAVDCCDGFFCVAAGETVCGICMHTPDDCDDERPCEAGLVCRTRPAPACSCSGAPVRTCEEPCPHNPCADDEVCVEADGSCRPRLCNEGFVCDDASRCSPGTGDAHGCAPIACVTNGDCPAGLACRGARCILPGRCSLPVP